MTFGEALEVLKKGHAATRTSWNGKGMYIYLVKGVADMHQYNDLEKAPTHLEGGIRSDLYDNMKGVYTKHPHIHMFNAQKAIIPGWVASQTDMLAEDWSAIEGF